MRQEELRDTSEQSEGRDGGRDELFLLLKTSHFGEKRLEWAYNRGKYFTIYLNLYYLDDVTLCKMY